MIAFLLTLTCIGAASGAACGYLSFEPRYRHIRGLRANDIRERRIQCLLWALMSAAGSLVFCLAFLSAAVNMGVAL